MLKSALMYLVPCGLALVLAVAIRLLGGPERGTRAAGIAVIIGFLAAWGYFLRPGWIPTDDFSRIGHIAFGAGLMGLALDYLAGRRLWAVASIALVVAVSTWLSINGMLRPAEPVTLSLGVVVLALVVLGTLAILRLEAISRQEEAGGLTAGLLLMIVVGALAFVARIGGEGRLFTSGLILVAALAPYVLLQRLLRVAVGESIILGASAIALALAWAVFQALPHLRPALLLVPLILFADGTAKRVPLPAARISTILYPFLLAGIAALPAVLAVLAAYVLAPGVASP